MSGSLCVSTCICGCGWNIVGNVSVKVLSVISHTLGVLNTSVAVWVEERVVMFWVLVACVLLMWSSRMPMPHISVGFERGSVGWSIMQVPTLNIIIILKFINITIKVCREIKEMQFLMQSLNFDFKSNNVTISYNCDICHNFHFILHSCDFRYHNVTLYHTVVTLYLTVWF